MAIKKLKTDGIFFTGKSSDEVTGSQYLVRFGNKQILLECGLHQSSSNSYLDSYKVNSEKFKFNPAEIDYVFICHAHIDHCGLIPRLVREGFNGKIIATVNTELIMKPLLLNSSYIVYEEARILSKKFNREYTPIYDEDDVYNALSKVYSCDKYNHTYKLDDTVSFQWLQNSHCLGAAQLSLELHYEYKTRKILYTSDIGALHSDNHFMVNTEIPNRKYDVVLMESTYGEANRKTDKTRKFDLRKLKSAINTTLERNGSVVFPAFSFSRTQEILANLYDLYHDDDSFKTDIIEDSQLTVEITKLYATLLSGENLDKWEQIYSWDNIKYITEKEDSKANMLNNSPQIIVSSSGFCTNGRVVNYLKKYLKDRNSTIIFSGYCGDNPSYLSYRIKNYRNHKFIGVNKDKIPNRADCVTLSTFSSHANFDDLVKFGSSVNTNKLLLVHGSTEGKKCLAEKLKEAISNNDKTFKVLCAHRGMIVHL